MGKTFLVFFLLLSFSVMAAEKNKKTLQVNWKPEVYSDNLSKLPPNYKGTNPIKFWSNLKAKEALLDKKDLETTEEYKNRISNIDSAYLPLSKNDQYAFLIAEAKFDYDADNEEYKLNNFDGLKCNRTLSSSEYMGCIVDTVASKISGYKGVNSFGVSLNIKKIRETNFGIAVNNSHPFIQSLGKNDYSIYSHTFKETFKVSLAKAKLLKNQKLGFLIVGNITEFKTTDGWPHIKEPVIDSPTDVFIDTDAVIFDPKKAVLYVIGTGEILGEKVFQQDITPPSP
jgi:hypothetical protein